MNLTKKQIEIFGLYDELDQWTVALEGAKETVDYLMSDGYRAEDNPDHEHREMDIDQADAEITEAEKQIYRIKLRLKDLGIEEVSA